MCLTLKVRAMDHSLISSLAKYSSEQWYFSLLFRLSFPGPHSASQVLAQLPRSSLSFPGPRPASRCLHAVWLTTLQAMGSEGLGIRLVQTSSLVSFWDAMFCFPFNNGLKQQLKINLSCQNEKCVTEMLFILSF